MTIAYWCVFAAVLMPYACFGIANNRARGIRDNRNPRDFPNRITGVAKRAWDAHLNGFESLPGFAAAAIIAQLAHAPQARVDALAAVWVIARIAFIAFYLAGKGTPRSLSQFVSLLAVLGLFLVAALA